MNKLIVIIIFSILTQNKSKDFEGTIDYEIKYSNISISENEADLKQVLGTKMRMTVKNGFTKEVTNSNYGNFNLYIPSENKMYYSDKFEPETLYYTKGDKEPNIKATYKIVKNVETVLDFNCNKLIYNDGKYTVTYFYSRELKIDPTHVKNFTYLNRNKKLEIMQAVCLKQIITTKNFTATMTAVKVYAGNIDDSEFIIPKYKFLKKE